MTGFTQLLEAEARPEWRDKYLNFVRLKDKVKEAKRAEDEAAAHPKLAHVADARKVLFQGALDSEVQKVLAFYRAKEQELCGEADAVLVEGHAALEHAQAQAEGGDAPAPAPSAERAVLIDTTVERAQRLIQELTHLVEYISLNMKAIRKILKKYAKNVEPTKPTPGFMTLEIEHPRDPGWHVLQGTFLPASIADELSDMQQHTRIVQASNNLRLLYEDARAQRDQLEKGSSMRLPSMGLRLLSGLGRGFEALTHAEEEAARNSRFVRAVPWAERAAGMFEPPPPEEYAVATRSGLVLNNLSTLLFMANYTAVLPPTDKLCEHIGIPASWTGAIMAASDAAAIFTSVGISVWTQRSFKSPLLFSALSCLAGNLMFVASYQLRSLPLLLGARLLNGLGSARTANRRYTADYVSKKDRTMASAAFVGCSNLGQALGPFLSLPLAFLPYMMVAGVAVNPVTAVGWVMALLWAVFFVCTWICFEEPAKRMPIGLARNLTKQRPAGRGEAAGGDGVTQPLLPTIHSGQAVGDGEDESMQGDVEQAPPATDPLGWRTTIPGTLACVACLFVQKAVQQAYMDGVPLFTSVLYKWNSAKTSLFLGSVGLAMVPVNVAVGFAATRFTDRSMVLASVLASMLSLLALMAGAASSAAYFGGGVALFVGTVVLEGTATSLMSKCIWSGFARGVFNAGLLSTEAGTFGRFTGNAALTLVGRATGVSAPADLSKFAVVLHGGLAAVCAALLAQLGFTYARLDG